MKTLFPPEDFGALFAKSQSYFTSEAHLREAKAKHILLESRALLGDREHNLHVDLGVMEGIIPREECAIGIKEGEVRDIAILSRVNKPVCFYIVDFKTAKDGKTYAVLSRKAVQEDCRRQYISTLSAGDVIDAAVTRLESFGAFCDVGAGIPALLPIDSICVSRIPHPKVRFVPGQNIKAIVKSIAADGKITLSHKELLGTWEENVAHFAAGETVPGIVRSIEKYGIFIELAPNLAGLAEYTAGVQEGESASVYIKSICPEKMKIKLILVDHFSEAQAPNAYTYPDISHLDSWQYSPKSSEKQISSVF